MVALLPEPPDSPCPDFSLEQPVPKTANTLIKASTSTAAIKINLVSRFRMTQNLREEHPKIKKAPEAFYALGWSNTL
jgi:hypothetical protein